MMDELDYTKACESCKCYPDKQPMGCACECHENTINMKKHKHCWHWIELGMTDHDAKGKHAKGICKHWDFHLEEKEACCKCDDEK